MSLKGLNMSEREKTTLLIGLFAVLIVAFYFYMYQPTEQQLSKLDEELAIVTAKLAEVRQVMNDPLGFEEQMYNNKAEIEAVETRLPSRGNLPQLIRLIEQKAKEANLAVVSIKPSGLEDKGDYFSYSLDIQIKGNYPDTVRYFEFLEALPRLVNLTGWSMQKGEDGVIVTTLRMETYGGKGQNPIPDKRIEVPEQNRNPFV